MGPRKNLRKLLYPQENTEKITGPMETLKCAWNSSENLGHSHNLQRS